MSEIPNWQERDDRRVYAPPTVISAEPGYFLVTLEEDRLNYDPIIGWLVTLSRSHRARSKVEWFTERTPISVSNEVLLEDEYYLIKCPDGLLREMMVGTLKEEDALEHLMKLKERDELKAKAAE
jgi:hypothetical protein